MLSAGCGGGDTPELRFVRPASGVYVEGVVSLEVEASAPEKIVELVLSTGSIELARLSEPPFVFELDTRAIPDGPTTLTAEATFLDITSVEPASLEVLIDNQAPSVEILPPHLAFQEDGDTFTVRVLASDGNGITKVAARVVGTGTDTGLIEYAPSEVVVLQFAWEDVVAGPLSDWSQVMVTVQAVDGFGRQSEVERAFDVGTRLMWSANVAGVMLRPPVVADDATVWVGATKVSPDEGRIVRLDPATGAELCERALGLETVYSGVQAGALLVFGTSRAVRAFRRDDCVLAWTFGDPVGAPRSYWGTPAYDSNAQLVYAADAAGRLVAINALTGAGALFADVAEAVQSSPLVTATGEVLIATEAGNLFGFDATGMALPWSPYATAGSIFGDLTAGASGVYFGSMDSYLYGLDPITGSMAPGYGLSPDGFAIRSTPGVAADGTVIVASIAGTLHALGPGGQSAWTYALGPISRGGVRIREEQGGSWSAYIGSTDGAVYAFGAEGQLLWRAQAGAAIQTYGTLGESAFYIPSDDFRLNAYDLQTPAP